MESESSSFRTADQLQSGALQDQAVRTDSVGLSAEAERAPSALSHTEKVVIRMQDALIKGHMETPPWGDLEGLLRDAPLRESQPLRLQRSDTGALEEIPMSGVKAVFFVSSFKGNERHRDLKFYTHAEVARGIWLRVEFFDGEVMEGFVHNSIHYLTDTGFFLLPTDPDSNNKLVYVVKSGLKDCRVLGVRSI
jgi:hypothetical protein